MQLMSVVYTAKVGSTLKSLAVKQHIKMAPQITENRNGLQWHESDSER